MKTKSQSAVPVTFGHRLRELRIVADMTGAELAKASGYSRKHVFELETGAKSPSWECAVALAAALKIPLESFLEIPKKKGK